MKKLLALVLALVMVMGLATVSASASAKTFADDADITYKEAVDVLSGVGVLSGMGENKFAPKEELTRAQAAKIIAYLDLGETAAENLPASKTFSDVPADHWASKYIAYCYSAGIVGGVGGGKFDPDGKLTGYAFGKMLLVVLGYDTRIEGFSGNDWMINVASVMNTANIGDDVNKAGTLVLTREEAAEYALDALKADVVKYDNKGTTINTSDGTSVVVGSSKAEAVTRNNEGANNYAGAANTSDGWGYQQLCEKRYGTDLKFKAANDDFGRPSSGKWTYKNEDITDAVVKTDDLVISTTGKVTFGDLYTAIGTTALNANTTTYSVYVDGDKAAQDADATAAQNATLAASKAAAEMGKVNVTSITKNSSTAFAYYTFSDAQLTAANTAASNNNGNDAAKATAYNNALNGQTKDTKNEPTDKGALTEVYKQENNGVYTITIVVMNTYLAKATEDYDTADKELDIELVSHYDGTIPYAANLTGDNDTLDVEDFAVIANVKEDDYLLVTIASGEVKSVAIPQTVKDVEISVFKTRDNMTADGTAYKYSKKAVEEDTVGTGDEVDLVLDAYGKIIGVKDADGKNTVSDYVFIKDAGKSGFDYVAKLVFMSDGSEKTVTVAQVNSKDVTSTDNTDNVQNPGNGVLASGNFATYKVKSNGEYKLTYVTTKKSTDNTIDYSDNGAKLFAVAQTNTVNNITYTLSGNSKTVFVADGKVYTGVKNAPKTGTTSNPSTKSVYYTLDDGKYFEAMFTETKGKSSTNSDEIVYILKSATTDFSEGKAGDDTYYVVDTIVDGSKTSYSISDGSKALITDAATNGANYTGSGKGLYVISSYDGDYPELEFATFADDNVLQAGEKRNVTNSGANYTLVTKVEYETYDSGTLTVKVTTQNYVNNAANGNAVVTYYSYTLNDNVKIYTVDTTDSDKTSSISAGSIKNKATNGFSALRIVLSSDKSDATVTTLYMVK